MGRLIAALFAVLIACSAASAQGCGPTNPNCIVPDRPAGDSTSSAANTKFVTNAVGGSGVSSFNGRSGAVVPVANDYTMAMIAGGTNSNANTWAGLQTFNANQFALAGVTGSTQCLHANSSGVVTGTGSDCGAGGGRPILSGNTSYFVDDINGSDSNTCLASGASACKTLNGVIAKIAKVDLGGFAVTVNVAAPASSYAGMTCSSPWIGLGTVTFVGNTTTPTNVPIADTLGNDAVFITGGCVISIGGFSLSSTTANGLQVWIDSAATINAKMDFGAAGGSQIWGSRTGVLDITAAVTLHGNAQQAVQGSHQGQVRCTGCSFTWTGNSTYSVATFLTDNGEIVGTAGATVSNGGFTVTGTRFAMLNTGSIIQWNGNTPPQPTDIPGTVAGTYILSNIANSLGSDVGLNASTYTAGPTVAQGTTGTWFASGTVTLTDTGSAPQIKCRLSDGTTIIASAQSGGFGAATALETQTLSGVIASPAGNLRIECIDVTGTTGLIKFNSSGNSKDSTLTAIRIN